MLWPPLTKGKGQKEKKKKKLKKKHMLHDMMLVHPTAALQWLSLLISANIVCEHLSTLHKNVYIPKNNNPKHKPETVLFYNQMTVGVDVLDQMSRLYSVKASRRKWQVHIFTYH